MRHLRGSSALIAVALVLTLGCEDDEKRSAPPEGAPTASAGPLASGTLPVPVVPTPVKPVSFASKDGAALSGDLYLSPEPNAPAVVLVHRLSGERAELAPLADRLKVAAKRYTILNFDLRGHGASKAPPKAKRDDSSAASNDVEAAIAEVEELAKPRSIVLVGTSLGAALISEVAFASPKVSALALISPGAAIAGHDLYRPYAEVRNLPTFIAGAKDDTVSKLPLDTLEKMAMSPTVKRYDGSRHSAAFLGAEHPELWSDLETWLIGVFDEAPKERKSLYYAPGKEPKARAKPKKGG